MELIRKSDAIRAVLHNEGQAAVAAVQGIKPIEAKWVEDEETYCGAGRANYKCTRCGKIGGTWRRGLTRDQLPNYCGNCGAWMGKENADADN